jgi:hypothetical protein
MIAGALVVLGFGLTACTDVAANDLEVGDCTSDDLTGAVGEVDTVDCDESHLFEVHATFDLEGDDYPGTTEVQELARDGCTGDRFEDYVGTPYAESEIYAEQFLVPTEQTWDDADDRTVICFAYAVESQENPTPVESEGSVEGAAR